MAKESSSPSRFEDDDARGQGYVEEDEDDEEKEEVDVEYVKMTAELLGEVEELSLQVSRVGNPRPVERNLVAELDASADDDDDDEDNQGVVQGERPPLIPRATRNADTPSAHKWPVLGPELTQPINSTGINQLVEDTVLFLKTMGYRCNSRPNRLILSGWSLARASAELTQWKRRLRAEFGSEKAPGARQTIMDRVAEFTQLGADPSRVPLPMTPETKRPVKDERFRSTVGTPRKENEPICDFLIRLTGYARTAKIQYEKGGADPADQVEQFLLNCGDDGVMDLLYPLQLADIQRVEQIINKKILGEKRKKQRDRMVAIRVGEGRRSDGS
ncbi:unnamed protein product [Phytophthora fragariaefolia]|uniref:Unnamed protein product n=1 Tax=Phytophthora fragariaefolia TaxID=1490495 RepID=A0A9W6Y7D8_9STRA|nr:unnamed protein product [Phytophthora fragariaefolia]